MKKQLLSKIAFAIVAIFCSATSLFAADPYDWQISSITSLTGGGTYDQNTSANPIVANQNLCSGGIQQPHNLTTYTATWYRNSIDDNTSGTVVSSQTLSTVASFTSSIQYTPSTSEVGTYYYYVVLTNPSMTTCGFTDEIRSETQAVTVNSGAQCDDVPSQLSSTGTTNTTADVAWLEQPADSFKVQYRKTGTTTSLFRTAYTNSYTLSNLQSSRNYEFRVRAFCNGSSTAWSGYTVFTTQSNGVPETLTATQIGDEYKLELSFTLPVGANKYKVRYKPTSTATWKYTAKLDAMAAGGETETVTVTQRLVPNRDYEAQVKFFYVNGEQSTFQAVGNTVSTGLELFTYSYTQEFGTVSIYGEFGYPYSIPEGSAYKIRYKKSGTNVYYYLPKRFFSSGSSWAYEISEYISENIQPNSQYVYEVKIFIGDYGYKYQSTYGSLAFTTETTPDAIVYSDSVNAYSDSADITLSTNMDSYVDSIKIRYRDTTSGSSWKYSSMINNSFVYGVRLYNLSPLTVYEYEVRGWDAGGITSWAPGASLFTTTQGGGATKISVSSSTGVYPNPASDAVTVGGLSAGQSVSIVSLLGAEVASATSNGSSVTIDVSGIAPGVYLVLTGNDSHKLVIE